MPARLPRFNDAWLGAGVVLLLLVVVFLPLLAVILNGVLPGLFFGRPDYQGFGLLFEMFERPLWYRSLQNSLTLAIGAATLGTVFGGLLAAARAQWRFAVGRWLDIGAWVLLITPSFMLAQGWILFAGGNGLARTVLGWQWITPLVFQPAGLVVVMALSKFSLAYLTIRAASEWNASHLSHAARLAGAGSFTAWLSVRLPLLLPAYVAGWTLVFIDVFGDFGLPAALSAVYRFPTLPYSIYSAIYQSPVRFDMAGVLTFYLVLVLALAMALLLFALRRARFDFLTARAQRLPQTVPRHRWALNLGTGAFLLVAAGIPVGASVATSFMRNFGRGFTEGNFTLDHYRAVLSQGALQWNQLPLAEALQNSFYIAGAAAVLSMLIGFPAAYALTFTSSRLKGAMHLFSLVSLAVPGVVLGIGYIFIWNQPWLEPLGLHLYGAPTLLVMAAVAGAIPYAVRVQLGSFATISPSLLRAAAVQGASLSARMKDIILPLVRHSLLVVLLAAFGTGVFDLAIALMLQPPNYALLPIVINKAFESFSYGYSMAATVIGTGAVILLIVLIQMAGLALFRYLDRRQMRGADAKRHLERRQIRGAGAK